MRGPPDPDSESPAAANGRAKSRTSSQPHQLTEMVSRYQALFESEHVFGRKFVVEIKRRRSPSRRSA